MANEFIARNGIISQANLEVLGSASLDSLIVSKSINADSITGSLLGTASYADNSNLLDGKHSSIFATTSSNVFSGSQIISGTVTLTDSATTFTIVGNGFGQTYLQGLTGALVLQPGYGGVEVIGDNAGLKVNGNLTATGTDSYLTGSLLGTASYANTASFANDFTVAGTLTVQTIHSQTITASTEYVTGSTQFGSILSNTHQFTGSVGITGSLEVTGPVSGLTFNNIPIGYGSGSVDTNIAIGQAALALNTIGQYNTVLGRNAALLNNSGSANTAVGYYALQNNTDGGNSTAIGVYSLNDQTTGGQNIGIGNSSLYKNDTGAQNVAIGTNALSSLQGGSGNTAIGSGAGLYVTGSSNGNIYIGNVAGPTASIVENNQLYINNLIRGDFDFNTVTISGSLTATSFTGSFSGSITHAESAISASYAATASYFKNSAAQIDSSTLTVSSSTLLHDLTSFKGAIVDYVVSSGSSLRVGTFTAVWNGGEVNHNEYTTADLGNTAEIEIDVSTTGEIYAAVSSGIWTVNSLYRALGTA